MSKLAEYKTIGDSASLAKIDEKSFTIVHIETSDYAQGDEVTPGVKITTKESYNIDGTTINKFHTTRVAVVRALKNPQIREDVNNGMKPLGPVKCVSEKSAAGKNFFNLIDA